MRTRNRSTTSSGATQITGLDQAQRQHPRLSVALLDHQAAEGDPCSRTRYHQKSYLTGSLAAEGALHHSVRLFITMLDSYVSLTYAHIGGGMFDTGPQFVFNLGGGPGFRVHQFGGGRPRRRPREANGTAEESQGSGFSALSSLLPLLILFILPLLSSLFSSSSSTPAGPSFRFDSPVPPHTMHRTTSRLKVDYFYNPNEVVDYTARKMNQLDQRAEIDYVAQLRYGCELETQGRDRMMQEAQGWFFQDVDRMREARSLELRSCRRLNELGVSRNVY